MFNAAALFRRDIIIYCPSIYVHNYTSHICGGLQCLWSHNTGCSCVVASVEEACLMQIKIYIQVVPTYLSIASSCTNSKIVYRVVQYTRHYQSLYSLCPSIYHTTFIHTIHIHIQKIMSYIGPCPIIMFI